MRGIDIIGARRLWREKNDCNAKCAAPKKGPVYISFTAPINQITTDGLIAVVGQQVALGHDEVHLMLSTPGGSVSHGITLYNVLRAFPIKLITHNTGQVASIGNAIFLAGEERYACTTSRFMFHGVAAEIPGKMNLEVKQWKEQYDSLVSQEKLISDIIEANTNISTKKLRGLFQRAAFMDANEAHGDGVIHAVRDVKMPKGTPFLQLTFGGGKA